MKRDQRDTTNDIQHQQALFFFFSSRLLFHGHDAEVPDLRATLLLWQENWSSICLVFVPLWPDALEADMFFFLSFSVLVVICETSRSTASRDSCFDDHFLGLEVELGSSSVAVANVPRVGEIRPDTKQSVRSKLLSWILDRKEA